MWVLLYTKNEQKVIGNWFCAPKIFKNPLKEYVPSSISHKKIVILGLWNFCNKFYTTIPYELIFINAKITRTQFFYMIFICFKIILLKLTTCHNLINLDLRSHGKHFSCFHFFYKKKYKGITYINIFKHSCSLSKKCI